MAETTNFDAPALGERAARVRATVPLVHCITNYVTVNDCANALLACGGSPIMSDEPEDVADITSICGGLVLNIGTLNRRSLEGMAVAGVRATELGHPIVLDPVGAGASRLRTEAAANILDTMAVTVVRGNMSEIKAVAGAASSTRGVDVDPADVVTDENLASSCAFARNLAEKLGCVVAITGVIDVVADAGRSAAIRNGHPIMGKMTGSGCMLSAVSGAYVTANPDDTFMAEVAAIAGEGLAGEVAASRMGELDGNGSFRTYLLDALYNLSAEQLAGGARVEWVA
ncbi:MAG: hydroxyethylthiazole kinase [Coriobacteriia bacterium]|nr:hydroxyethylthiazole kinase [Coriobacteriia bacterium]